MTTHGRILVRDRDKKDGLHLYAWSDGHTKQAVLDLLQLPWTILDYARLSQKAWLLEKQHIHGHWFYQNYMSFALDPDRLDQHARGGSAWVEGSWPGVKVWQEGRFDRESFREAWQRGKPLSFHYAGVANWMSWVHFDRWTVVPDLEYCAYPGDVPDLTVAVSEEEEGYYLMIRQADEADQFGCEMDEKLRVDLMAEMNRLNALLSDKSLLIAASHKKSFPVLFVPLPGIVEQLMWQEIVTAYAVLDGSETAPEQQWLQALARRERDLRYNREELD